MKKGIAVISTKNPTNVLLVTVNNVQQYYPDFDIVIIDSDSTNIDIFKLIPSDVIVCFIKNNNWELGAWHYAFNQYNNYEVYMFIQDTLIPTSRIPELNIDQYINNTFYSCHYHATISDGGYYDELCNVYRDTNLSFISEIPPNTYITGAAHTSFITNKSNVKNILQLEEAYIQKQLNKTKIDSWLTERTAGIMSDVYKNIRIDCTPYFYKIIGYRDHIN